MKLVLVFIVTVFLSLSSLFAQVTVKIYPVNQRQSSGLYVNKGDVLNIKVTGSWSLWDKYKKVGGEGHSEFQDTKFGNWGALLGKIGNGDDFIIGNGVEKISDSEGILYLFPNKDKFKIENESGNLDVIISGGTPIEELKTRLESYGKKIIFDPKNGISPTDLFVEKGDKLQIYAIGSWTMWYREYPEVSAEGHDFMADGIAWGKLYGSVGSTYGEGLEYFSIGERTTYFANQTGVLTLFPYIGNYVSVKNGELEVFIIGAKEATVEQKDEADKIVRKKSEEAVLEKLNRYRASCKLSNIEIDPRLSETAFSHAKYMILNDTFAREQEEGKNGFTGINFEARLKTVGYEGKAREMFCQSDLTTDVVDIFFKSVYHRIRLMSPELKFVGYGNFKSGDKTIHVFDYGYIESGDTTTDQVIIYPEDNATDIDYQWSGLVNPDPFPSGTVRPLGYPITILFIEQLKEEIKAELTDNNGNVVDCFIISPETDINNKQLNAITLVPKKILDPNTNYTVNVVVKLGSKEEEKSYNWSFKTKQ